MAKESRTTLKTYFQTFDVPTETQFSMLIDSIINQVDDSIHVISGNEGELPKVGIGTPTPTAGLDVNGKTRTKELQVTEDAQSGYVLTSDDEGNATWQPSVSTSVDDLQSVTDNGSTTTNSIQVGGLTIPAGANDNYVLTSDSNGVGTWQPLSPELNVGNSVFVSKSGDDATGVRGRFDRQFLTIQAAVNAWQEGDTIIIYPGTYDEQVFFGRVHNGQPVSIKCIGEVNLTYTGTNNGGIFNAGRNIAVELKIHGQERLLNISRSGGGQSPDVFAPGIFVEVFHFGKITNTASGGAICGNTLAYSGGGVAQRHLFYFGGQIVTTDTPVYSGGQGFFQTEVRLHDINIITCRNNATFHLYAEGDRLYVNSCSLEQPKTGSSASLITGLEGDMFFKNSLFKTNNNRLFSRRRGTLRWAENCYFIVNESVSIPFMTRQGAYSSELAKSEAMIFDNCKIITSADGKEDLFSFTNSNVPDAFPVYLKVNGTLYTNANIFTRKKAGHSIEFDFTDIEENDTVEITYQGQTISYTATTGVPSFSEEMVDGLVAAWNASLEAPFNLYNAKKSGEENFFARALDPIVYEIDGETGQLSVSVDEPGGVVPADVSFDEATLPDGVYVLNDGEVITTTGEIVEPVWFV